MKKDYKYQNFISISYFNINFSYCDISPFFLTYPKYFTPEKYTYSSILI